MRHPPLQPPLFWQVCLLFWCAGILAALWPAEGLTGALLLLLADPRLRAPRRALLALAVCAAGLAVGLWQLAPLRSPPAEPAWLAGAPGEAAKTPPVRLCGTVRRVAGLPDGRLRVILENVRPEAGGEALAGRVAWTWDEAAFRPLAGQSVCLERRPVPVRGFANSAEPVQEARWAAQDVFWRLWSRGWSGSPTVTGAGTASARLREDLRRDLVRALLPTAGAGPSMDMPQAKAMLPALLFGDRSFLSRATVDEFAAASLAHSLALSGQHLALAGLVGLFSVLLLARVRPGIYLFRARAVWVAVASLPPALAYLWLGNAPASLLRAACMLGLMTLWLLRGRTATPLDALLGALACIVLADPLSLFDLSLQLSVLCVAVICLTVPGIRRLWPAPGSGRPPAPGAPLKARLARRSRAVLHGLGAVFLVSFCIQLALLPFMLARFGTLGLWFPLNVPWLPAVDLVVLPGAALGLGCAVAGLEACARVILDMAALPCQAMLACLDMLQRHGLLEGPGSLRPHWAALAAFAALGVALAVMAGDGRPTARLKARRWLVAGLLLLCVGPALRLASRLDPTPRLEVLDVGQGLATYLRLPGHVRILVDGGGALSPGFDTGKALLDPLLTANDAPRLDAVINTHPDLDHVGGLFHLLRSFGVQRLFHNGRDAAGELRQPWREARQRTPGAPLAAGDKLVLGDSGGYALEVLHPPRMAPESGDGGGDAPEPWAGNKASLVLRLTRNGEGLALFTGDVEPAVLRRLLAEGADISARILVAPHHGSDRSFLPAFHEAVRPELVLAGCGFRNRWGYPGRRLGAWLAARHIPLLDTGTRGRISVELPETGPLRVSTARQAP
ncbi:MULTISPECIES: ComEC/Rec2 family competence protein [unclassified Desulfovibrio]|uniref:ComEC/Rec2 family competence protein n=1 Tax=unclassified Desulfovibrio TaxID=2593640 RepID=UPI0013EC67C9|nr:MULTISPECIES: ComEC/Rec2 family competence protein [unclassified Desulfovibrio]